AFAATHANTVGGVVLSAHFSPLIADAGGRAASYLGVAEQSAWTTCDQDKSNPNAIDGGNTAFLDAPVGFLVKFVATPSFQMIPCARYGQDAMELFGNGAV